jgi:6-phosphogluconolactonase
MKYNASGIALLFLFFTLTHCSPMAERTAVQTSYQLLVGTYTSGKSEGIYVYAFDTEKGTLSPLHVAKGVADPSYLTASPGGEWVYAVNEQSGEKEGMVSAFRYDKAKGALSFLNQQPSGGGDPCYLTISPDGKHLLVANYSGGSIGVLPIEEGGRLGAPLQVIEHEGSSVNEKRQEKPHVHSVVLSPDGRYLLAGDLGTDQIVRYPFNTQGEQPLQEARATATPVEAGSGPRHLLFGPGGNYVYLVQELTGSMAVFRWEEDGLQQVQTISMTSPDFEGEVSGAELRLSPDGKFLYASNRGDANEIVVYAINESNGLLRMVDRQASGGKTPRNFLIDPSGQWLLVAHQDSNNIVVFKRDAQSGRLSNTNTSVEIDKPVYLMLMEAGGK